MHMSKTVRGMLKVSIECLDETYVKLFIGKPILSRGPMVDGLGNLHKKTVKYCYFVFISPISGESLVTDLIGNNFLSLVCHIVKGFGKT
jgi:hypothetical protein